MSRQDQSFKFGINSVFSAIFLILVFVGLFFIARGIFIILSWLAPIFLIATLIINHRVVLDFLKMLVRLVRTKPIMGIIAVILSVIGFPIVTAVLLGRALFIRKLDRLQRQHEEKELGEYVDFEEIEEELDLPQIRKEKKTGDTDYDQFF